MKTAILAILLFGLLIFPHELGHFIAAKKSNVKVKEFAFGMGPVLWKKQRGETLHSIRLFPIGGFCAMEGEDEESNDPRAFSNTKPWKKLIILLAGATMNFVVAILISTLVFLFVGSTTTTIKAVTANSPAELAGIMPNDKLVYIGETKVETWADVSTALYNTNGEEVTFVVNRNGEEVSLKVTPVIEETKDESGNVTSIRYIVGITSKVVHNPFKAVINGIKEVGYLFKAIFQSFAMLFNGEATVSDLSGPVGVVQLVGEAASYSIYSYFLLAALISINVGVLNLLPLPALDGGRVIFVLFTLITGKEVNEKIEGTIHAIGLMLILGLSIFIAFNDVIKIFK